MRASRLAGGSACWVTQDTGMPTLERLFIQNLLQLYR